MHGIGPVGPVQTMRTHTSSCCGTRCCRVRQIEGYRGGYVLRREDAGEVRFVVVNLFDSLEAVKAFAGPDYETPVFEPEARRLLSRYEPKALHYDVRVASM